MKFAKEIEVEDQRENHEPLIITVEEGTAVITIGPYCVAHVSAGALARALTSRI